MLLILVIVIAVIILIYAFAILLNRGKIYIIILTTVFLIVSGILLYNYYTNPLFRCSINTLIEPISQHNILGTEEDKLPLPSYTALRYRYSEKGAVYYTKTKTQDVIKFYKLLTNQKYIEIYNKYEDETILEFKYGRIDYSVIISKSGNGTNININAN